MPFVASLVLVATCFMDVVVSALCIVGVQVDMEFLLSSVFPFLDIVGTCICTELDFKSFMHGSSVT
jgi:hypothetical protein